MNRCGFVREKDELAPEGEYRPIYPLVDRLGFEPIKVVYLDSPTKRYKYVLQEVIEK